MRIVSFILALILAGCSSSSRREDAQTKSAMPAPAIEVVRRQQTFVIIENRDLPPGTPDPGLMAAARSILNSAGLKEDAGSAFRIQMNWRGEAIPHDYRTYVGGRSMLSRYTGAVVSGSILFSESGREFYRKDFSVPIRPMLDFQFHHDEHMKNPAEAPFRAGIFAYETPGEGPVAALARAIGSAHGEPVARWALRQPEDSLKYAGAEMAGQQRIASLRPILENLARGSNMMFPDPAVAAAEALGYLPRDTGTIALLKQLARSTSMAWVAAFTSLVNLRLDEQTPELIDIMVSARVLLPLEGLALLEQARLACTAACKQPLSAYRAKLAERLAEIAASGQDRPLYRPQASRRQKYTTEGEVLKQHRDLVDEILLRFARG